MITVPFHTELGVYAQILRNGIAAQEFRGISWCVTRQETVIDAETGFITERVEMLALESFPYDLNSVHNQSSLSHGSIPAGTGESRAPVQAGTDRV